MLAKLRKKPKSCPHRQKFACSGSAAPAVQKFGYFQRLTKQNTGSLMVYLLGEKKYALLVHDEVDETISPKATVMYSYAEDLSIWHPLCTCAVESATEILEALYAQEEWYNHTRQEYERN
jgi:hypothetical protein